MSLPSMKLGPITIETPIIQGGMGIGYSNFMLAGTSAKEGALGVLSSAGSDYLIKKRHGIKLRQRQAIARDVQDAKEVSGGKPIGMNIMVAVTKFFEDSVLGSMDGGVDVIISGAGLPMKLPAIVNTHPRKDEVALIPIASSGRAFELICRKWQKTTGRLPDAVIVEGPLAGGHLAWRKIEEAEDKKNKLELLVAEVLEVAKKYGDIPVLAAGGVYTHEDIKSFMDMGCVGVQMGTRFLATHESGASEDYKQMIIDSKAEDIALADKPGSPSGLLFRVLKKSPFYIESLLFERAPKCSKGILLTKGGDCKAKDSNETSFCICNGLMAASDHAPEEKELYTVGQTAERIDKIIPVKELMTELLGN